MKRIPILLIVFLFTACQSSEIKSTSSKKNLAQTIQIDLEKASPIHMSEFFSNIDYIYLKTPFNRPIGMIWKIMIQKDYIALYDRPRKSVWIYSKTGKFINEVSIKEGKGPQELQDISDVTFSSNNIIHVLGRFKIVTYNIEGNFLNEFTFKFFVYNFIYNSDTKKYVANANNNPNRGLLSEPTVDHNLYFFKNDGVITDYFLPIEQIKKEWDMVFPIISPPTNPINIIFPILWTRYIV